MKLAVIVYLALATAAGPWVCCCTAAQLAPKASAVPAEQHKSCCCPADDSQEENVPDQPLTPTRPCSCQDERQPGLLASSDVQAAAQLAQLATFLDAAPLDLAISPANDEATDLHYSLPLTIARDILRIFQILRC